MLRKQAAIYTARTRQDAHFLKNLLAEAGIEAVVLNDVLEGGSGVDVSGWATAAKVIVDETDAQRARQMAMQFDRQAAAAEAGSHAEPPEPSPLSDWPRCPHCDARRSTRCPVCSTGGTDFPEAEMGFTLMTGLDSPPDAAACCGPGGCTPPSQPEATEPSLEEDDDLPQSARTILMCPTCDEPFEPVYLRVCEWCGHEFADGHQWTPPEETHEPLSFRAIAAIIVLLALLVILAGYFLYLV